MAPLEAFGGAGERTLRDIGNLPAAGRSGVKPLSASNNAAAAAAESDAAALRARANSNTYAAFDWPQSNVQSMLSGAAAYGSGALPSHSTWHAYVDGGSSSGGAALEKNSNPSKGTPMSILEPPYASIGTQFEMENAGSTSVPPPDDADVERPAAGRACRPGRTHLDSMTAASSAPGVPQPPSLPPPLRAGGSLAAASQSAQGRPPPRPAAGALQAPKAGASRPPAAPPQQAVAPPAPPVVVPGVLAPSEDEPFLPEYTADYYRTLHRQMPYSRPDDRYMERQSQIHAGMRAILVDWLIDVHRQFKMRTETLYLAISFIDRYLSKSEVARCRLQLVGVAAMFIAAKFEEIHPPELKDFVYICASAYTKEDVISMEARMLSLLNWGACAPTASHFLPRFTKANGCSEAQENFVHYLVELSFVEYDMIGVEPQHLVAAAVLLVNRLYQRRPSWPALMADATGFTEAALFDAAERLKRLLETAFRNRDHGQLKAVWSKFAQPKRSSVATLNLMLPTSWGLDSGTSVPAWAGGTSPGAR